MKLTKGEIYTYQDDEFGPFSVQYNRFDKDRFVYIFKVLDNGFEHLQLTLKPTDLWQLNC